MSEWRIVKITREQADERTFDSASEAQDEMRRLWRDNPEPGVEYSVAHVSYPLARDDSEFGRYKAAWKSCWPSDPDSLIHEAWLDIQSRKLEE